MRSPIAGFVRKAPPLASSSVLQEDVVHQSRDWSGVIRLRTCKNARKRISRETFDRLVQTVHGLARTLAGGLRDRIRTLTITKPVLGVDGAHSMNGDAQTAQERKDGIIGRFTEKSLMENNTECTVVCVHVGDRGLRKECAQRVPSALCTQASPNQRRQFRLIRRPKSA